MVRSPKTGRELGPDRDWRERNRQRRRTFLTWTAGGLTAILGGVTGLDYLTEFDDFRDRGDTVHESADIVNNGSYFDAEASIDDLGDGDYQAVMRLDPIDRDVVTDGEPAVNAIAEELGQEGHYLFGEDNEILTNMQPFYDRLGKFNATRRDDDQQIVQYTVEVPGLEDEVAYTASAREMRAMEKPQEGPIGEDAIRYELDEDRYWDAFLSGLEPV